MDRFPPALPHGRLHEIFPEVFFVTGAMETELAGDWWKFSRNMTVVREGGDLTLINAIRLNDAGLAELERLGRVKNVVRLGALHGRDDAFYARHYDASLWRIADAEDPNGAVAERTLRAGDLPIRDAQLFQFEQTRVPEGVLHLDRDGGILIACDALQHWVEPEAEYFDPECLEKMNEMGFFQPANIGPVWAQAAAPQRDDFERLLEWDFRHMLPGHGSPLRDRAHEAFRERVAEYFS